MPCEIRVVYTSEGQKLDSYRLSLRTEKFFLSIDEPYCYEDDEIDGMLEIKEGCGVGGGGNSAWSLMIKDGLFHLEYEISGAGMGSTFVWTVEDEKPLLEMLGLMKKINKLIKENKVYASSSDHIKILIN